MNRQASTLFDISSFSFSGGGAGKGEPSAPPSSYLRRLIRGALARGLGRREGLEAVGERLAAAARHAYLTRQTEAMREASGVMLALPLSRELRSAAAYYQAISTWKRGEAEAAREQLGRVIGEASASYRAQGLLSIGATYFGQGRMEEALRHYLAAARAAAGSDLQTFVTAQKMAAVVRGIYDDHQQAVEALERLFPFVRAIAKRDPACYYDFLNSYAVELGEVGRLREAQEVCAVPLASPFAGAYPEFAQTREELAAKRTAATPSVIAVPAAPAPAPVSAPQAQAAAEPAPARARLVIAFKFMRACSPAAALTTAADAVVSFVSARVLLDRLVESTLPRGPPALS